MKRKTLFFITCGLGVVSYFTQKHLYKKINHYKNKVNIGTKNNGKYNIGSENTGDFNIGGNNLGSQNLGNYNIGQKNYGDFNTGDKNYGYFNIGKNAFGCFNTKRTPIYMFNKRSNMTIDKWLSSEAYEILSDMPSNDSDAQLRQFWYDKLPEYSKNVIKNIDNFNPKIFERITGINTEYENSLKNDATPLLSEYHDADFENFPNSSELAFETAFIVENSFPDESLKTTN